MKKDETLKTVANYAKEIGKTTSWVYQLINSNKVKCRVIDGVKFIVTIKPK